jgi:oxygen-independent coproporphyrinogen III oxidase
MAGIYIHIPFCLQKCYYCDFYKIIQSDKTEDFLEAFGKEVFTRKEYLSGEEIETIYIGGGTPSLLSIGDLNRIFRLLKNNFNISHDAEVTLEANPDDLNFIFLKELKSLGVNRLSIGIQAFQDAYLKKMNRRHSVKQAIDSVMDAEKAGFNNIGVDLIYGIPGLTLKNWESSLYEVFNLPVMHLSAYHLTYHKGTLFYSWLKSGKLKEVTEEESVKQFEILTKLTSGAGFEHYEISNFAKNGLYSRHNTAYWTGKKYLGLGPSAHSYNGYSRRWNISSLKKYINAIKQGESFCREAQLSVIDQYNEYLLTNLRTKWGVSLSFIKDKFGIEKADLFYKEIQKFVSLNKINGKEGNFFLTHEGLFTSDDILAELMII